MTQTEGLERLARLVAARRGGTVFTPNVDHVVLASEDDAFREAYADANLSLIDGMGLVWACRLLGHEIPEKVSGADMVRPLLARAAADGWRVYLFGGAPGVVERARALLSLELPTLNVVGAAAPRIDLASPVAARLEDVRRIRQARPDVVLVALGSPKGERWSQEMRSVLEPAVIVAVGAALDFIAGAQRRAPRWMSNSGLEWLYRLASDPRRLARRYLVRDPKFGPIFLRSLRERRGKATAH